MKKFVFGILALVILTSGCATYQTVTFKTIPENADIYINGVPKGKSPVTESLVTDAAATDFSYRRHTIIAKMEGYNDEVLVLQSPSYFFSNTKPFPEVVELKLKKKLEVYPSTGTSSTTVKSSVEEISIASSLKGELPPLRYDTYAVVIGIDYKGRHDIPNLQYPSQDAKKVYDILTDPRYGGVPKENTVLLLNEKATRNEMSAALRKIKNWDGYVYVYYSGHGAPKTKEDKFIDAFLVPYDVIITDPDAMEDTSIKISYLNDLVDSSQAKGVMVALDACFSGGGKSIVPKGGKPLVGMLVTPELIKPKGTGRVIITSSATNQQSWEDETELKGGIFSYFLLEGLKGKAGKDVWVKVDDLTDYIKDNVPKTARKLKGVEQNPQVSGKGDFAVTRNWEREKVMDIEIAKNKLKNAFEKGYITAEQLNKALDELKSPKHSKTLDAFLEGKIDEKKFGELY